MENRKAIILQWPFKIKLKISPPHISMSDDAVGIIIDAS